MHARHRTLCKKNKKGSIDWAGPCGFQDQLNRYLPKIRGHNRPRFLIPQESGPCRLQTTDTWFVFKITHDAPQGSGTWRLFCPSIFHTWTSLVTSTGGVLSNWQSKALSRVSPSLPPPLSLSPRFIYFLKNANFRAKTRRSSSSGHRRPQRLLFRGLTEEESRTVQVTYRRGSWDSRVLQSKRSVSLNILIISQNF